MNTRVSLSSSSSDVIRLLFCIFSTWFWLYEFVYKTIFTLQIPHKIRIKSKIHKRGDEERRKTRKTKKPLCSSKRNVCCFGNGIQINLLTLIQVSAICLVISPATNWRTGLVCAVVVVCPLEPRKRAPAGCSPQIWSCWIRFWRFSLLVLQERKLLRALQQPFWLFNKNHLCVS